MKKKQEIKGLSIKEFNQLMKSLYLKKINVSSINNKYKNYE